MVNPEPCKGSRRRRSYFWLGSSLTNLLPESVLIVTQSTRTQIEPGPGGSQAHSPLPLPNRSLQASWLWSGSSAPSGWTALLGPPSSRTCGKQRGLSFFGFRVSGFGGGGIKKLFSDPGTKGNPFLGKKLFSGAATKKRVPLNN